MEVDEGKSGGGFTAVLRGGLSKIEVIEARTFLRGEGASAVR